MRPSTCRIISEFQTFALKAEFFVVTVQSFCSEDLGDPHEQDDFNVDFKPGHRDSKVSSHRQLNERPFGGSIFHDRLESQLTI